MLEFRMLGRLAVVRDGTPLPLPAPQVCLLLGVLLACAPAPAGPAELTECLGDSGHGHPLHVTVSRLRRWLAGQAPEVSLERVRGGYRLRFGDAVLDADRLRRDNAAATDLVEVLDRALQRFRGAVLADQPALHQLPGVLALQQHRVDLAVRMSQACLAAGNPDPALARLAPLRHEHPLDERLAAGHAELLAAGGRRADALDEIDRLRRRLRADLGVDAGDELMAARLRILRAQPPEPERRRWRGPRPYVSLIGRTEDSARLRTLVDRNRLTTVTGPGGVGKTVLALDAAQRFDGAVAVAPLVGCTGNVDLTVAVLEAFGLGDEADPYERIARSIAGRRTLLVLDNCEHVRSEAAGLVQRLLGATAELSVLATSREPLGVAGETVWSCPPLSAGDDTSASVRLFLRRAAEATGGSPILDMVAVRQICRRLVGLPLAIELAAARLRAVSPAELAALIETDLSVLSASGAGGRHGTLDAIFTGSVRMMPAAERELLARVATFADGFTLPMAEATAGGAVAGLLAVLVDRSLVQRIAGPVTSRYRILEPLRDSARRLLCTGAERDRFERDNLRYWRELARAAWSEPEDTARGARFAGLSSEYGNIRHALENAYGKGLTTDAAELTAYLFDGWRLAGLGGEALRWHEVARRHEAELPSGVRALIAFNLAIVNATDAGREAVDSVTRHLDDLRAFDDREYREALLFLCMMRSRLFVRDPWQLPPAAVRRFSRSQRTRHRLLRLEELTTWGRWSSARRLFDQPWDTDALAGTELEVQRYEQHVLIALGLGRIAEAARAEQALRALADRLAPHPRAATLPAAGLMWLVTGESSYGRTLFDGLAALDDAEAPVYREMHARVLAAEGLRRAGDAEGAFGQLRLVLSAPGRLAPRLLMLVAPVCALLAGRSGDELLGIWDAVRRDHGLPVPHGFAELLPPRVDGEAWAGARQWLA